jgi:small-conductance mechanosensitive channel
VYFWCDVSGERDLRKVRSNIRYRISELFEAEGIVIAYPQRDVRLAAIQPLPVRLLPAEKDGNGGN